MTPRQLREQLIVARNQITAGNRYGCHETLLGLVAEHRVPGQGLPNATHYRAALTPVITTLAPTPEDEAQRIREQCSAVGVTERLALIDWIVVAWNESSATDGVILAPSAGKLALVTALTLLPVAG
jgi:hypothetical protein